ncbi:MAG: YtxH domain-containing protein [Armatimonadota bacterium]|nr:YtxH domain-containing protein [Armatimonadota bacterium]
MHDSEDKDVALNLLAGIGIGAIIGAVTALLLAPKSGAETREDVKRTLDDLRQKSEQVISDLSASMEEQVQRSKKLFEETKSKLQQAVDAGKKAVSHKKEEVQEQTPEEGSQA